ncbi:hypothetical protein AXF42_Ash012041 [Apostasia shenzhenica]|uniref:Uncharacterized protein n=1 Tax=Apostasia shenzhenica TaxID=1088818 RepID=A0A2I0AJL8_9ASPA|nr:hypothetical protein AXF42_Ash012041 [Apostasia shenzhenica]
MRIPPLSGDCFRVFVGDGVHSFVLVFRKKGGEQALGSRRLSAAGGAESCERRMISFNIGTSSGDSRRLYGKWRGWVKLIVTVTAL